jgi:hypothetical protein
MDPQATWQRLLEAYSTCEWATAKEAAEDLLVWLRAGGFPPQTLPNAPMDDAWNRAIAVATCRFVISVRGSLTA